MLNSPKKNPAAFTLVELLVVIAVIGILATITFNVMTGVQANARSARAEAEMSVIRNALEEYKSRYGDYPWISTRANAPTELYQALIGEWVPTQTGSNLFGIKPTNTRAQPFIDVSNFSIHSDPQTLVNDDINQRIVGGVVHSFDTNASNHYLGDPWGNPYYYYYKINAPRGTTSFTWRKMGYILISRGDRYNEESDSLYTGSGLVSALGEITDPLPDEAVDDIILGQ